MKSKKQTVLCNFINLMTLLCDGEPARTRKKLAELTGMNVKNVWEYIKVFERKKIRLNILKGKRGEPWRYWIE